MRKKLERLEELINKAEGAGPMEKMKLGQYAVEAATRLLAEIVDRLEKIEGKLNG